MADGNLCTRCGWQEAEHEVGAPEPGMESKRLSGARYALRSCPSFSDGIRHAKYCGGRDVCDGDCAATEERIRNTHYPKVRTMIVWGNNGPFLIDMGAA